MRTAILLNLLVLPLWVALVLTDSSHGSDWPGIVLTLGALAAVGLVGRRLATRR